MSLITWDPFEALDDIDRLFAKNLRGNSKQGLKLGTNNWLPDVDIHEDENGFYFDVEAPGVKKEDFDVQVQSNLLKIRGEKKSELEEKKENLHRIERSYGKFERSFSLPDTADTTKVEAKYQDGILKVSLLKKEISKPKKVDVKIH